MSNIGPIGATGPSNGERMYPIVCTTVLLGNPYAFTTQFMSPTNDVPQDTPGNPFLIVPPPSIKLTDGFGTPFENMFQGLMTLPRDTYITSAYGIFQSTGSDSNVVLQICIYVQRGFSDNPVLNLEYVAYSQTLQNGASGNVVTFSAPNLMLGPYPTGSLVSFLLLATPVGNPILQPAVAGGISSTIGLL